MADTADTADIVANTANILARCRCEVDTSSAARRIGENTAVGVAAAGEAATGVAETGAAIGGIIDSPVTDSSSPVDMVIRTGVGTLLGAGAFLTRTTAIILTSIIRMTVAPYQEGNSMGPDSGRALHDGKRFVVRADEKLTAFVELESAKDKVRPDSKVDQRMKRKRGRPTLFNAGLAARLCRLLERGWWPLLVKLRSGHSRACRTCERYNPLFNASCRGGAASVLAVIPLFVGCTRGAFAAFGSRRGLSL
jgi:hypothetical protein